MLDPEPPRIGIHIGMHVGQVNIEVETPPRMCHEIIGSDSEDKESKSIHDVIRARGAIVNHDAIESVHEVVL